MYLKNCWYQAGWCEEVVPGTPLVRNWTTLKYRPFRYWPGAGMLSRLTERPRPSSDSMRDPVGSRAVRLSDQPASNCRVSFAFASSQAASAACSREVPTRERVLGARDLFASVEYPALMHCKSGADRAGIMSVFYAHFRLGLPIREAMKELSLRYLHVKQGKTGVLDYVFERYLAEGEPIGQSFIDWVMSDAYDPVAIKADFKSQWIGTLLTEKLLRRE